MGEGTTMEEGSTWLLHTMMTHRLSCALQKQRVYLTKKLRQKNRAASTRPHPLTLHIYNSQYYYTPRTLVPLSCACSFAFVCSRSCTHDVAHAGYDVDARLFVYVLPVA